MTLLESAVNYWEKYGAVSFDPGQKAVLTTCILKTRGTPRTQKEIPAALAVAAQLPRPSQGFPSGDNTPAAVPLSTSSSTMGPGAAGNMAALAAPTDNTDNTSKSGTNAGGDTKQAQLAKRENCIKCCFSFTIRRDQWNIPTMIVGVSNGSPAIRNSPLS